MKFFIQNFSLKKKSGERKCGYFFTLGIIVPPRTIRIASINPAIGTAVCCMAIVSVSAFTVFVVLFPVFVPLFCTV